MYTFQAKATLKKMIGTKPILKPEQEKEIVEYILRLAGVAFLIILTLL